MQRYLAFFFKDYHPAGGWNDSIGMFDTAEAAFAACDQLWDGDNPGRGENCQVIDLETGQEVQRDQVVPIARTTILAKVAQTCKDHRWAFGEAFRVYWQSLRYVRTAKRMM